MVSKFLAFIDAATSCWKETGQRRNETQIGMTTEMEAVEDPETPGEYHRRRSQEAGSATDADKVQHFAPGHKQQMENTANCDTGEKGSRVE
ncbi:hypothetical protein KOW79_012230 [Hemibagrus wyckioides]|uniref:Uncharacterized protein n=1 Tax=Hemibagrus wyckioides TaxID=337641 RepID=A0A9D3SM17_9TELE|nr:hypothetical protein KOW79_012230 [Hemibagrus wyckioides]